MDDKDRAVDTRELMIRLDERLKSMQTQLNVIQASITNKVENDKIYQEMVVKVNTMWDGRNKALGYIAAWTTLISIAAAFAITAVKQFFFGNK